MTWRKTLGPCPKPRSSIRVALPQYDSKDILAREEVQIAYTYKGCILSIIFIYLYSMTTKLCKYVSVAIDKLHISLESELIYYPHVQNNINTIETLLIYVLLLVE